MLMPFLFWLLRRFDTVRTCEVFADLDWWKLSAGGTLLSDQAGLSVNLLVWKKVKKTNKSHPTFMKLFEIFEESFFGKTKERFQAG